MISPFSVEMVAIFYSLVLFVSILPSSCRAVLDNQDTGESLGNTDTEPGTRSGTAATTTEDQLNRLEIDFEVIVNQGESLGSTATNHHGGWSGTTTTEDQLKLLESIIEVSI